MHPRLIAASMLVALGLFLPSITAAQGADPSPEDLEAAKEYTDRGTQYYAEGEYSKAIVQFMNAHSIAPNAMFLYNISLSYAKLDNYEEALKAALKARDVGGMPEHLVPRNDARIVAFQTVLKGRTVADDISSRARVSDAAEEDKPDPAETEAMASQQVQPAGEGGLTGLGWTGVGLATVGAGMLVGAFFINQSVADDIDALEAAAADGNEEEFDRLNTAVSDGQTTGQILVFTGGGFAVLGATFVLIDFLPSESELEQAWRVTPSGDGATVSWSVRF